MKTLLIILIMAMGSGCATRTYVDTEVALARNDARRRTLASYSDLIDEVDRVDRHIKSLRKSVLTTSEIRNQLHRAYWNKKLDATQAELNELREEIIP